MSLVYAEGVADLCKLLQRAEPARKAAAERGERATKGEAVPDLAQAVQEGAAAQVELDKAAALAKAGAADAPRTHAIIIGVGAYPHLLRDTDQPAPLTFGLGQLTTSVISAQTFSDWLLTRFRNDPCPLGSVELLLSPGKYTPSDSAAQALGVAAGSSVSVEEATLENIKKAFSRWLERCDLLRDNVALFYFSGHGVEKEGSSLLIPSDFGQDQDRPLDRCIDITETYTLMAESVVKTQCFFIDACRETPTQLHDSREKKPGVPLKGDKGTGLKDRDAPIYRAAAEGTRAFGPPDGVSFFTQELLRCLDGLGAQNKRGKLWRITTDSLTIALKKAAERLRLLSRKEITFSPNGGESVFSTELHWADDPVPVFAKVECVPGEAHGEADLMLLDAQDRTSHARTARGQDPWLLEIASGEYRVLARFDDSSAFASCLSEVEAAHPPEFTPDVNVPRR